MPDTIEWFSADVPIIKSKTQAEIVAARKEAEQIYSAILLKPGNEKWRSHKPKFKWGQADFPNGRNHVDATLDPPNDGNGGSAEPVTTTATARVKPPPPPPAPPPSL